MVAHWPWALSQACNSTRSRSAIGYPSSARDLGTTGDLRYNDEVSPFTEVLVATDTHMKTAQVIRYELVLEYANGNFQAIPVGNMFDATHMWRQAMQTFRVRSVCLTATIEEVPDGPRSKESSDR